MIKIVAVIRPHKLAEVQKALVGLGIHGLTVTEVKGHGHQGGHTEQYRGTSRVVDLVCKLRVETVVESARADEAIETLEVLVDAARTGAIGDGKVFVENIDEAVRIRTGERGDSALPT
jgi:nitrogen regulatory protein PII